MGREAKRSLVHMLCNADGHLAEHILELTGAVRCQFACGRLLAAGPPVVRRHFNRAALTCDTVGPRGNGRADRENRDQESDPKIGKAQPHDDII